MPKLKVPDLKLVNNVKKREFNTEEILSESSAKTL